MCFSRPGVATAIFIFLTSDGPVLGEGQRPTMTVELTDVTGTNHSLGECDSDPFRATRGEAGRPWSQPGACVQYCLGPCLQYTAIKIEGMLDIETWYCMNGLQYYSSPCFSSGTHELSCQHNPLVINVTHHLDVLSHRTTSVLLNFSSPLVGISAVALRTSSHISPSTLIPEHEGQNHQGQRYRVYFLPCLLSFPCGCDVLPSFSYIAFCFQWVLNH